MKNNFVKRSLAVLLAGIILLATACTNNRPPEETEDSTTSLTETVETNSPETEPSETETDGSGEDIEEPTPPSVSLDLLTFTPASPKGQVLTEDGKSPQILITNYNETAIDALGRVLPTSEETGLPKENRYVGLFYSLWTSDIVAAIDNSKALHSNPYAPNFGARWNFCFWAEPETGYHRADDVWQIRRDLYYFAMAGVDFLYFDMTNGYLYENAMEIFLETSLQMRAEGLMTPYVVPWCYGSAIEGNGDMGRFYERFMAEEKYKDMWFYWEGKPLALIKPVEGSNFTSFPIMEDEYYQDKITFRKSWVVPGSWENYWVDNGFEPHAPNVGFSRQNGKRVVECAGICVSGFANFGQGRSEALSAKEYLNAFWETETMGQGIRIQKSFDMLMEKYPDCQVLLISRWNEWIAQNFTDPDDRGTDTGFVDQFNPEFSRDIEPMKGGYTDNYFYQMCSIIRRFKGVLPADGVSGAHTMTETDADIFEKWEGIAPVYTDFEGDTSHRDYPDTTGKIQYVNTTGRNDIVESRVTTDGGNLYVYARTAKALTSPTESKNWMLLFIDADADKSTGWEGYDYLINYEVVSDKVTTICAYKDGVWQEIGTVAYAVKGDRMTVTIPRSLLGLNGETVKINFHWMDNVTDIYDLESWFTTGDSAPERRNNYVYEQAISYTGKGENILSGREGDTIMGMPAQSLSAEVLAEMKEGLMASFYPLVENYPAQPDFRLIDSLIEGSKSVTTLTVEGLPYSKDVGVVYEGYIKVTETEAYDFELSYDDGAKLFVDGRLVVDGSYDPEAADGIKTAKGSILLEAGYHAFRVEYAELKGGNAHLSLKGEWVFSYSNYGQDIEELPAWTVDISAMKDQKGYNDQSHALGIYAPYMYLEYDFTAYLGNVDLSQYSRVEILYCCDGSDITKQRFEDSSSLAIGLKSENSSYGFEKKDNFNGDIAHTDMVFVNKSWAAGARTAVVDLSKIDYNGDVWLGLHNPAGTFIAIMEIRFYGSDSTMKPDTDPVEPDTDPVEPDTDPVEPETPEDEFDMSKVTTVSGGPGYKNDQYGIRLEAQNGTTVLNLGTIDLSKYTRIEIAYGSDGGAKLGDEGCFFALDDASEAVKDAGRSDIFGAVAAENATVNWQPDRTAIIDLSGVEYDGTVYLTFYMGSTNGISIYGIKLIKG